MTTHDVSARVFDQGPTVRCAVLTPHQKRIPAMMIFTIEVFAQAFFPHEKKDLNSIASLIL